MEDLRPAAMALSLALLASELACGTSGVDVNGCRQIEEARCRQAAACGIPLTTPDFTSGTDVESCIRYYDTACLHGLAVSDPGAAAVNACVAAIMADSIKKDGCSVVRSPQTDQAACGWLGAGAADAGADANDASSDAADAADAADATGE